MSPSARRPSVLAVAIALSAGGHAHACLTHTLLGLDAPPAATWQPTGSAALHADEPVAIAAAVITDPAITSWRINTTNLHGTSPVAGISNFVSHIDVDVRTVAYSATHVYVRTSGVPSHSVGPFNNGPLVYPADQSRTARIPRNPQVNTGTKTPTGLGNIGIMVNGTTFFDPRDARTYNNQGVWQQNANYFEASNFDPAKGHPAPQGQPSQTTYTPGNYHYHQSPLGLINQLDPGNTGQHHSPLIGFAFDGFPIYGPYGYANPDGTGGFTRQTSSYQLRNITTRTTLPSGNPAPSPGPAVSAQFPLGAYIQDFAYVAGSGTLDQHNGRFAVTPEYPSGTYAYFVTLNATGSAVYPYIVGPTYYGVVDTGNLQGGTITVPADVTYYTPPTLTGDTNNDGVVDVADLNNVLNNFGATGPNAGDTNDDGTVDLTDLNNVLNHFGASAATTALSVVPEPSVACLFAPPALLLRRRHR